VRPAPEIPVPVPQLCPCTHVPGAHRETRDHSARFAREDRIRMWRPRKSNPTLAAQLHAKGRPISQIPTNSLPRNLNTSSAFVLTNPVLLNLQEKGTSTMLAQSPPSTLRLSTGNPFIKSPVSPLAETKSPTLATACPSGSPAHLPSPRIHQQISEPPSPLPSLSPIRKNQTSYRRRIETALNRSLSVFHASRRITPQPFVHFLPTAS